MNVLMETVVVLVLQTDCKVKFLQEQKSEGAQHVFASTSSHGEGRARKSCFFKMQKYRPLRCSKYHNISVDCRNHIIEWRRRMKSNWSTTCIINEALPLRESRGHLKREAWCDLYDQWYIHDISHTHSCRIILVYVFVSVYNSHRELLGSCRKVMQPSLFSGKLSGVLNKWLFCSLMALTSP